MSELSLIILIDQNVPLALKRVSIVKTHQEIDRRSLALAQAIVEVIDRDPERKGLQKARENCDRWWHENPTPAIAEWRAILTQDWETIRVILLKDDQQGQRLRQSNPFCGVISPQTRWAIYRRFNREPQAA